MGSTYLSLTNQVLGQLNEIPLDQDNFNSARGIHSTVKNTVSMAVQKINAAYHQWPWNAAQHTQNLEIGVSEYAWPIKFSNVDWNSFSIILDDDVNSRRTKSLTKVNRNQWYPYYKELDDNLRPQGRNVPVSVFESHGYGFGISPSPDKAYPIVYRYYKTAPVLMTWDQTVDIPSEFDYVIVLCALSLMKTFKNDPEGSAFADSQYRSAMSEMRANFGQQYDRVRSSVIPRWSGFR